MALFKFLAFALSIGLAAAAAAQNAVTSDPSDIDADYPPAMLELTDLAVDGSRLAGLIYLANGPGPHPTVLLLHGFPGNEKNLDVAQALRRGGWNVAFFHYRGAWGSEGEFTFTNALDDVGAMLEYLRAPGNATLRVDGDRIALVGHSMGGFMAIAGGARDRGVKCITGIAAANFGAMGKAFRENPASAEGLRAYSDGLFMLRGFGGDVGIRDIVDHADAYDLTTLGPALTGRHVLLIAGTRDTSVPISVYNSLIDAFGANDGLSLTGLVLNADHSFSWLRIRLASEITEWLNTNCR